MITYVDEVVVNFTTESNDDMLDELNQMIQRNGKKKKKKFSLKKKIFGGEMKISEFDTKVYLSSALK